MERADHTILLLLLLPTKQVSSTTDSEEEMENNFAFTLTEYLDLIMLMALLGALFLVIITRQRRLRRANPPPTH